MTTPLVSIVIPARNAAAWIAETLGSVVAQTCARQALEVIVVDDGSSDETGAIAAAALRETGLPHSLVKLDESSGPSAARNVGWRQARGAWIQFLDADDLLDRSKIGTQLAAAEHISADAAVIYSTWGRLRQSGGRWSPETRAVDPVIATDVVLDLLRGENFIATGSQLIRRSWLDRVDGFRETYRLIEDVDLHLRIAMAGGLFERAASRTPLFWYRQRLGSLSQADAQAFAEGCVRNAALAETWWRERNDLIPARAQFLAEVYCAFAEAFAETAPARYAELRARAQAVAPGFVPVRSRSVTWLGQLVGDRRAAGITARYRRLRRSVTSASGV